MYVQRIRIVTLIGVKHNEENKSVDIAKNKRKTPNTEHIVKSNINYHSIIEDTIFHQMHKQLRIDYDYKKCTELSLIWNCSLKVMFSLLLPKELGQTWEETSSGQYKFNWSIFTLGDRTHPSPPYAHSVGETKVLQGLFLVYCDPWVPSNSNILYGKVKLLRCQLKSLSLHY